MIEKGHSKGHYGGSDSPLGRNAEGAGCYLIYLPDKTSAPGKSQSGGKPSKTSGR
jgi:hypothetical protein